MHILKAKVNGQWVDIPAIKGNKGDKGDTGSGVPAGGSVGQVLRKHAATDYDTEWSDETDFIKGYLYNGVFYADSAHTTALAGKQNRTYVNLGVEGKALYMYNGSVYLRIGGMTKDEADALYAPIEHTHTMSEISDVDFLTAQQIIQILNQ